MQKKSIGTSHLSPDHHSMQLFTLGGLVIDRVMFFQNQSKTIILLFLFGQFMEEPFRLEVSLPL